MKQRLDRMESDRRGVWLGRFSLTLVVMVWALAEFQAQGIILLSTGDPAVNTTPPTGILTNSGWQFQGTWGRFLGTPIASNYFITAKHIEGTVGDVFIYQGQSYETLASYEDPESDLKIWRVCGRFESFAPLATNLFETGHVLMVFGRGTQRGDEVRVNGQLKGWRRGTYDLVQRWGQNVVSAITPGGSGIGDLLTAAFNATGGANEAHLSIGDSGGAVFIQEDAVWKLAGINYSVDGPYNTNTVGAGFQAAIFDEGGLYTGGEGMWALQRNLPGDRPGAFYATRISTRISWINDVLSQTPAPEPTPAVETASSVTGPYVADASASVDAVARTITLPNRGQAREFFRLSGCTAWRITSITRSGADFLLNYGD